MSTSHHHFGIQREWYHPLVSVLQDEEEQIDCVCPKPGHRRCDLHANTNDLQSPAVSGELLSSLDLMLGIIFSAGYNAGPFLLTAASAARCPRVPSPTRHWRSQPEPLSPHACALLRSLRSPARSVAWGISPKEGLTSSARRGVWERQSSLCPSDSQAL